MVVTWKEGGAQVEACLGAGHDALFGSTIVIKASALRGHLTRAWRDNDMGVGSDCPTGIGSVVLAKPIGDLSESIISGSH